MLETIKDANEDIEKVKKLFIDNQISTEEASVLFNLSSEEKINYSDPK